MRNDKTVRSLKPKLFEINIFELSISFLFLLGVAITQLGGITNALREKTRLTGSNAQNRKQYQEYQNTIASQNAGTPMKNMLSNCIKTKPNNRL